MPEHSLMHALREERVAYSLHDSSLPGKPDLVFKRNRIALFVDSDFWHAHPKRFTMPRTHRAYWRVKIMGNKRRDRRVNRALRKLGWRVIRVWEYDIRHSLPRVVSRVLAALTASSKRGV